VAYSPIPPTIHMPSADRDRQLDRKMSTTHRENRVLFYSIEQLKNMKYYYSYSFIIKFSNMFLYNFIIINNIIHIAEYN